MKNRKINQIFLKQNLYKTHSYFRFRNSKKPNLKKLKALINSAEKFKLHLIRINYDK
jgi:hypothetical protein